MCVRAFLCWRVRRRSWWASAPEPGPKTHLPLSLLSSLSLSLFLALLSSLLSRQDLGAVGARERQVGERGVVAAHVAERERDLKKEGGKGGGRCFWLFGVGVMMIILNTRKNAY